MVPGGGFEPPVSRVSGGCSNRTELSGTGWTCLFLVLLTPLSVSEPGPTHVRLGRLQAANPSVLVRSHWYVPDAVEAVGCLVSVCHSAPPRSLGRIVALRYKIFENYTSRLIICPVRPWGTPGARGRPLVFSRPRPWEPLQPSPLRARWTGLSRNPPFCGRPWATSGIIGLAMSGLLNFELGDATASARVDLFCGPDGFTCCCSHE